MRTIYLNICCLLILLSLHFPAQAQFTYAEVGINGLTCSQCSRSVELSIRKLPFVKDVEMNLEHTEGKIIFTPNGKVDIASIAQAVKNAGFSVRYMKAGFIFTKGAGSCFNYKGDTYNLVRPPAKLPDGATAITFLGATYQPKKDFKKWQAQLTGSCGTKGNLYYITL